MTDLAGLSDSELVARENALRAQVSRGLNDGCREYLVAVVCEQGSRAIAECQAIIAEMSRPSTPIERKAA